MQGEFFKFVFLFLRKRLSIYLECSWKQAKNATYN